jgi:hypothetical protein
MAQQTQATERKSLQEVPDPNAFTTNVGSSLCNRPDARVAYPDALQCLLEVSVAGPDAVYANLSLSRINISEAYLKMLIGCLFVRNII